MERAELGSTLFRFNDLSGVIRQTDTAILSVEKLSFSVRNELSRKTGIRTKEVDLRAGLVFAGGGMIFAPAGSWLGTKLPAPLLLSAFAWLMAIIGMRMGQGKPGAVIESGPCVKGPGGGLGPGCYARLIAAGSITGMVSGLFGVGGGFIIVPALLCVTGMSIHRAVATSLLVIFLISLSGVAAHVAHGQQFPMPITAVFIGGGFAGMFAGHALRKRLPAPLLQRVFAVGMWIVAAYMLVRNLSSFPGVETSVTTFLPRTVGDGDAVELRQGFDRHFLKSRSWVSD